MNGLQNFIVYKTTAFNCSRFFSALDQSVNEGKYFFICKYYVSTVTTHHLWPAGLFFHCARVFHPGISQAAPFPGPPRADPFQNAAKAEETPGKSEYICVIDAF